MVSLEYARLMCEDCRETVQLIHPGVPFDKLEVCKCKEVIEPEKKKYVRPSRAKKKVKEA